jgi:hypothetical protein
MQFRRREPFRKEDKIEAGGSLPKGEALQDETRKRNTDRLPSVKRRIEIGIGKVRNSALSRGTCDCRE